MFIYQHIVPSLAIPSAAAAASTDAFRLVRADEDDV